MLKSVIITLNKIALSHSFVNGGNIYFIETRELMNNIMNKAKSDVTPNILKPVAECAAFSFAHM